MPWRFSDAGRLSAWMVSLSRRPRNLHTRSVCKSSTSDNRIARFAATPQPDEVSDRDSAWATRLGATSPDYVLARACAEKLVHAKSAAPVIWNCRHRVMGPTRIAERRSVNESVVVFLAASDGIRTNIYLFYVLASVGFKLMSISHSLNDEHSDYTSMLLP